jgi:hypothetical protein
MGSRACGRAASRVTIGHGAEATMRRTGSAPAASPTVRERPGASAQRPFPSMGIKTCRRSALGLCRAKCFDEKGAYRKSRESHSALPPRAARMIDSMCAR